MQAAGKSVSADGACNRRFGRIVVSILTTILSLPAAVIAQTREGEVETIVITAQKREQRFIDVPINLTALSGDFLSSLGYFDIEQVSTLVPGVFVSARSPNAVRYSIRGISNETGFSSPSQFEPRVSIYENGVPISRNPASYVELFDIERVEVLKGPQSTLFGRSAEIGAVSVITNKAADRFSAHFRSGGGNFDYFLVDTHVNVPITEKVFARAAVIHRQREGYQKNLSGGHLNGLDVTAGRLSLRLLPADDLTIDVITGYQHDDPPAVGAKSKILPTLGSDTSPYTAADLERGNQLGIDRDVWSITGIIDWRPSPNWAVTSNTSWWDYDSSEAFDGDGSASPALFFRSLKDGKQFNQEVRTNYSFLERGLTGFFGLNFFYEDASHDTILTMDDATVVAIGPAPTEDIPGLLYNEQDGFVMNGNSTVLEQTDAGESYEADIFADTTYRLIDALELTVGVRGIYLWKRSSFVSPDAISEPGTTCPGLMGPCADHFGGLTTSGVLLKDDADFGDVVGRVVLAYGFEERFGQDATAFASWSRGWRPKVVQVGARGSEIVPAETVDSFEIGGKGLFFDRRLLLEGSFYYYLYDNFQLDLFDRESLSHQAVNGRSATGMGTELSMSSQVSNDLKLFGSFAWTNPRFDEDVPVKVGGTVRNLEGARFRLTPEYQFNIGGQGFRAITREMNVFFMSWFTWQSEIFFENSNDPRFSQGSYGLWNARIGADWTIDSEYITGPISLSLFAYNLLDKQYLTGVGDVSVGLGLPTFTGGPPRLWGGEIRIQF